MTGATWGGSIIKGYDGYYHMYVSQMLYMCGLNEWATNSIIVHTKSKLVEGPYYYVEDILGAWSHNPQPHKSPDGTQVIYHIGNGKTAPWGPPQNCSNIDASVSKGKNKKRPNPIDGDFERPPKPNEVPVNFLYGPGPVGPWKSFPEKDEDPCDNPTVYFFPNGSLILLYRMDIWANSTPISEIHMATADSWMGPYKTQSPINTGGPIFQRQGEDPFIFRDKRGNFHLLFHDMQDGYPVQTSWSGSHGFSRDGLHWTWTPSPAYTSIVEYETGWVARYARRERPQLIFEEGRMFLSNGIQVTDSDDMTFTLIQEIDLS